MESKRGLARCGAHLSPEEAAMGVRHGSGWRALIVVGALGVTGALGIGTRVEATPGADACDAAYRDRKACLGVASGLEVRLDGEPVAPGGVLAVAPGQHGLELRRGDVSIYELWWARLVELRSAHLGVTLIRLEVGVDEGHRPALGGLDLGPGEALGLDPIPAEYRAQVTALDPLSLDASAACARL
jgi:hypothetical protein